jgi:hypothetical protein
LELNVVDVSCGSMLTALIKEMMRTLGPLLLALALSNAHGVDEQSSFDSLPLDRSLSVETTQRQGEICGNNHACTDGLECVQVGLFRRCIPQTGCLAKELRKFERDLISDGFKREILVEANVTEDQVAEAAKESQDLEYLNQSGPIWDVIQTLQKHVGAFDQFESILSRCSSREQDAESVIYPTVTPETDHIPVNRQFIPLPTPIPTRMPTPNPAAFIPLPTPPPTNRPSSPTSFAPSSAPTLERKQTVFVGFHIEGGALLEGSVTVVFNVHDPTGTPTVYAKGCLGVGAAIGADLSIIVIVAETTVESEITCLSAMYSVDIGIGLNLGYGLGVCLLTDPPFVYQEFTLGAGVGVGASTFSMCNGIDTGIDLGIFGGGRADEDNEEDKNGNQ